MEHMSGVLYKEFEHLSDVSFRILEKIEDVIKNMSGERKDDGWQSAGEFRSALYGAGSD